jgi:tetratricopeptide (TPR) repeat protein
MFRWVGSSVTLVRRHPIRVLLALLSLLGLAVLGAYLYGWRYYTAAEQAIEDERYTDAREDIYRCLRVWRWSPPAYLLAARIERYNRHYVSANELLNRCEALLGGGSEGTQLEWVCLRAETGELTEVEPNLWRVAQAEGPLRVASLETLARVYIQDARNGMALMAIDKWLKIDPGSARAWYWKGWVEERRKSKNEAIAAYQRSVELQPDRWQALNALVALLMADHRAVEAWPYVQRLSAKHPKLPQSALSLAGYHVGQGHEAEAAQVLDRLLQDHPDLVPALLMRGKLACDQRQPREGEALLRKARELQPREYTVLFEYHRCLMQLGRAQDAATVQEEMQRVKDANARLDELMTAGVEKSGNDPATLVEVGRLLAFLGLEYPAIDWYYRALRANPDYRPAHEALERFFHEHGEEGRAHYHQLQLAKLPAPVPSTPMPPR